MGGHLRSSASCAEVCTACMAQRTDVWHIPAESNKSLEAADYSTGTESVVWEVTILLNVIRPKEVQMFPVTTCCGLEGPHYLLSPEGHKSALDEGIWGCTSACLGAREGIHSNQLELRYIHHIKWTSGERWCLPSGASVKNWQKYSKDKGSTLNHCQARSAPRMGHHASTRHGETIPASFVSFCALLQFCCA